MKMFVALVSGVLLSSAAFAQHVHGASTGGNETAVESGETAASAEAATTGTANANAPAAATGAERVICRRVGRTESRVSRASDEMCMTARQWRAFNRNN